MDMNLIYTISNDWYQWWTEAGKIPKYRIPKLWYSNRTEPNNTEPNHAIKEIKGFSLFIQFLLKFFYQNSVVFGCIACIFIFCFKEFLRTLLCLVE